MLHIKKILYLLVLFIGFNNSFAQRDTTELWKTGHFYIQSHPSEEHFHNSVCFDIRYIDNACFLDKPYRFFDSLGVISIFKAFDIACKVKKFELSMIKLTIPKNKKYKAQWEFEINHRTWLAHKAPRKYRRKYKGRSNGISVKDVIVIDAVSGKIIETQEEGGRFIMHF